MINLNNFFAIGAAALLPEPPCSTIISKRAAAHRCRFNVFTRESENRLGADLLSKPIEPRSGGDHEFIGPCRRVPTSKGAR